MLAAPRTTGCSSSTTGPAAATIQHAQTMQPEIHI